MSVAIDYPVEIPVPARAPRLRAVPCGPGVEADPRRATRPAGAPVRGAQGARVTVLHPPADLDRPAVRLTRRGVAVLALAVAALGAALVWVAALSAPGDTPASGTAAGTAPAQVTVHAGDTLWSIAQRTAPGHDPRAEVDRLQALNHLDGVTLDPGQVLRTR